MSQLFQRINAFCVTIVTVEAVRWKLPLRSREIQLVFSPVFFISLARFNHFFTFTRIELTWKKVYDFNPQFTRAHGLFFLWLARKNGIAFSKVAHECWKNLQKTDVFIYIRACIIRGTMPRERRERDAIGRSGRLTLRGRWLGAQRHKRIRSCR